MASELADYWGGWANYFKEYKRQRAAAEAVAVTDEPDEVLQAYMTALPSAAPSAPKRLYGRLEKAGWEVWLESARTRVGRKYFKSGEREGELKSEPFEMTYWQVRGRRIHNGGMVCALKVSYATKHREKDATTFDYAMWWDVVTSERVFSMRAGDLNEWLDVLAPKEVRKAA